jgi:dTDP-glucose 4,6-dehydratase
MNEINPKSILVTGGCGFIGSNFIRYILRKYPDTNITNLDKLTYAGNIENLTDIEHNERYRFIRGDIQDRDVVDRCMENVDSVVHFAAESHVDRSITDASEFIKTNVLGTYVLLQSSLDKFNNGGDLKRFVMISTDEVYGSVPIDYSSREEDTILPRNPYSASKAGADRLAYSYHETHGLPVVITRSSNNFGPFQNPEKLLPLAITNLIRGRKIPLYGDGKNIRDWLYVEDNCKAVDMVLRCGENGEVYNIGGGNEIENRKFIDIILELMDEGPENIIFVEDRKGHDRRYSLDYSKIVEEVGWQPSKDLKEKLKLTINWYTGNESWWNKLVKK